MTAESQFDYRSSPRRTRLPVIVVLVVTGVALIVGCGIWLVGPVLSSNGSPTTMGTIVGYESQILPSLSSTVTFRPVILYSVNSHDYRVHSSLAVTRSDKRANPVGSRVTVRYHRDRPSSAEWNPSGSTLAVNVWGIVGVLLGIVLLAAGILQKRLGAVRTGKKQTW